jgi:hypothetical protein
MLTLSRCIDKDDFSEASLTGLADMNIGADSEN